MTFSGPYMGDPRPPLTDLLEALYRTMLLTHADDTVLGCCPVCLMTRCHEWRWASQELLLAGLPLLGASMPGQQ